VRIFIGFDPRQPLAYNVCRSSIERHGSNLFAIFPLQLRLLPIERRGLTEFTFSRYLVPHLCNYEGVALFLDADMIVRADITELFDYAKGDKSVWMVKNNQRFEWPSLMLFNNSACKKLTPAYIEQDQPASLEWAEQGIGDLPKEWNHCVGYDKPNPDAKLIHFTKGIPCWPETKGCEHEGSWIDEHRFMNGTVTHDELMGKSVHVANASR
jgi:lipopolysaccharide biosynthesis glycosyltransferase